MTHVFNEIILFSVYVLFVMRIVFMIQTKKAVRTFFITVWEKTK